MENGCKIPGQARLSKDFVNFKERDTVKYNDMKVLTYQSVNTS